MKFTAAAGFRNVAYSLTRCRKRALLAVACVLLMLGASPGSVSATPSSRVPLPQPRPADAPSAPGQPPGGESAPEGPDAAAPAAPPAVPADKAVTASPCRLALTEAIAVAPSIPPIRGPGACGGEDLVRLEAVVLAGGQRVPLKPPAILRCAMASAIADWVRTDLATLAQGLGTVPAALDNFDAYECRSRNRVAGAKLSEHGLANALDVRGVSFADGKALALTDRSAPRALREQVLHSVCARFSTVLGPGSDWSHEDHVHLDLAARRGGFRMCQWNVYDPLPTVAPLLPAERPAEAPSRQTAGRPGEEGSGEGEGDQEPSLRPR